MTESDIPVPKKDTLGSTDREITLPEAKEVLSRFSSELYPLLRATPPRTRDESPLEGAALDATYTPFRRNALEALVGLPSLRAKAESMAGSDGRHEEITGELPGDIRFDSDQGGSSLSIIVGDNEHREVVSYRKSRGNAGDTEKVNIHSLNSTRQIGQILTLEVSEGDFWLQYEDRPAVDAEPVITTGRFKDIDSGEITRVLIENSDDTNCSVDGKVYDPNAKGRLLIDYFDPKTEKF